MGLPGKVGRGGDLLINQREKRKQSHKSHSSLQRGGEQSPQPPRNKTVRKVWSPRTAPLHPATLHTGRSHQESRLLGVVLAPPKDTARSPGPVFAGASAVRHKLSRHPGDRSQGKAAQSAVQQNTCTCVSQQHDSSPPKVSTAQVPINT